MKAVILGATGYTGMILMKLLAEHPRVDTIIPVSSSKTGDSIFSTDPRLGRASKLSSSIRRKTEPTDSLMVSVEIAKGLHPDVVFSALPHLASAEICSAFAGDSVIVDLSADFRLKDAAVFTRAYGTAPARPDLGKNAVYGLCEIYRKEIEKTDIIANPGCYPTASILPLYPLARKGLLKGNIIINALSGISGAGRKEAMHLLFCERTENTCAYAPGKSHRHCAEIEQEVLPFMGGGDLFFTPHLVPLKRGMEVTTAVSVKPGTGENTIRDCLEEYYRETSFVEVRGERIPETRDVWGTNRCDIGWHLSGNTLFLFSVIDNLVKGASGQAVQNMNIRFGFEETDGLTIHGEL